MIIQPGCRGCIEHQLKLLSVSIGRGDEQREKRVLDELNTLLANVISTASPPELAAMYYTIFERETGISDPYSREKRLSTELALRLLPELRRMVGEGEGAFDRALLLAIGGNVIDYGAIPDFELADAEKKIRQVMDMPYDRHSAEDLHRRMDAAGSILYILDNCGEAVIDRLLIERYREKITVGVRGRPILNDVTRSDALASGLDFVPIVDTGDNSPGVSLRRSSKEFVAALENSDLIIAKGQGNFESLSDDFHDRPAYYLLRTKCDVICRRLGAPKYSIQIIGCNLYA